MNDRAKALDRSGRWDQLPALEPSNELRRDLKEKMPGYRSHLHRHEWIKHGTCMQNANPEMYFRVSLKLLDDFNRSTARPLFTQHIKQWLDGKTIREAFEIDFGGNRADSLQIRCHNDGDRRLISELVVSLSGNTTQQTNIESLLENSTRINPGCTGGIVDSVGYQ